MLKTICYLSTSEFDVKEDDIQDIFNSAKLNSDSSITGILIYNQGNFFQIIEGRELVVDTLFEKIKKDERHKDIIVIANSKVEKRFFGHYKKEGFTVIKNAKDYDSLKVYINKMRVATDTNYKKIFSVLDNFIKVF